MIVLRLWRNIFIWEYHFSIHVHFHLWLIKQPVPVHPSGFNFKSVSYCRSGFMGVLFQVIRYSFFKCFAVWTSDLRSEFLECIEGVQMFFFKKFLNLPLSITGYAIWLETGSLHLSYVVFKLTLSWLSKIFKMGVSRYLRQCVEKLLKLAGYDPNNKFNFRLFKLNSI